VVAVDQLEPLVRVLATQFKVERIPHSLNVSGSGSKLRVQIQTHPRYFSFIDRARPTSVLGLHLPVATIEDILQGKIWAAQDLTRRPSKRRKDLLDIERIVENYPALREQVLPIFSTGWSRLNTGLASRRCESQIRRWFPDGSRHSHPG
jgi:hypothetical protein